MVVIGLIIKIIKIMLNKYVSGSDNDKDEDWTIFDFLSCFIDEDYSRAENEITSKDNFEKSNNNGVGEDKEKQNKDLNILCEFLEECEIDKCSKKFIGSNSLLSSVISHSIIFSVLSYLTFCASIISAGTGNIYVFRIILALLKLFLPSSISSSSYSAASVISVITAAFLEYNSPSHSTTDPSPPAPFLASSLSNHPHLFYIHQVFF
jgi:hypothetical protein